MMGDRGSAFRFLHLRHFGSHAETFVEVSVEDFDPLLLEQTNDTFALLFIAGFTGVQALTPTAHDK